MARPSVSGRPGFPMSRELQTGAPQPVRQFPVSYRPTPKAPGAPKVPSKPFGSRGPTARQIHSEGPRSTGGGKAPASRGPQQPKPTPRSVPSGPVRRGGAGGRGGR